MKPLYKILHDNAMGFVDEARRSKMIGNLEDSKDFFLKAFLLEKQAALTVPNDSDLEFFRYLYLRSAAYLAFETGNIIDAIQLINLGLLGSPPDDILHELKELRKKIKQKGKSLKFIGKFTQANAKDNLIMIEDEIAHTTYFVPVPIEKINDIVKNFWSSKVAVEVEITDKGSILLQKINAAA